MTRTGVASFLSCNKKKSMVFAILEKPFLPLDAE